MNNANNKLVRPLTPGELAELNSVTTKTLASWLRPYENKVGPRTAKYFTLQQVRVIYSCLGIPGDWCDE